MTLTDFLLARIAEDEAVARAATVPAHEGPNAYKPHPELRSWKYAPWAPACSGEVEYEQTEEMLAHKYAEPIYVTCDGEGLSPAVSEEVGPHIARHDPARVLAECAAKRQIVEDLVAASERAAAEWQDYSDWIEGCAPIERPTFSGSDPKVIPGLEHAARTLALPYADHPDYREEWKP